MMLKLIGGPDYGFARQLSVFSAQTTGDAVFLSTRPSTLGRSAARRQPDNGSDLEGPCQREVRPGHRQRRGGLHLHFPDLKKDGPTVPDVPPQFKRDEQHDEAFRQ